MFDDHSRKTKQISPTHGNKKILLFSKFLKPLVYFEIVLKLGLFLCLEASETIVYEIVLPESYIAVSYTHLCLIKLSMICAISIPYKTLQFSTNGNVL